MRFLLLAWPVMIGLAPDPAKAAPYSFTSINDPGAGSTYAMGINNRGQIVGYAYFAGAHQDLGHGFVDTNGNFTAINYPNAQQTYADGINNAGDIVGFYSPNGGVLAGFEDSAGTFKTLPQVAYAINDSGQIVVVGGILDAAGTFTPINVPTAQFATNTFSMGINNHGQISGSYVAIDGQGEGFVDTAGKFTTISKAGAGGTGVNGVNDAGQTVGVYDDANGVN